MMKNDMLFVAFVLTGCAHGMETNFWNVTFGGTKINLNQDDLLDRYADGEKKIHCIVIGQYQQKELNATSGSDQVGFCRHVPTESVRFKTKKINNNYKVTTSSCIGNKCTPRIWQFPKRDDICFLEITEPLLSLYYNGLEYGWKYCRCQLNEEGFWDIDEDGCAKRDYYQGDQAIEEMCKDLLLCYNKVLSEGSKKLGDIKEKSIALSPLSTHLGGCHKTIPKDKAAPVAVKTIVEFIENNFGVYDRIELFVEEQLDFVLYKELLREHCGLREKICLVCLAYNDSNDILVSLPRELIYYIGQLLYT